MEGKPSLPSLNFSQAAPGDQSALETSTKRWAKVIDKALPTQAGRRWGCSGTIGVSIA